MSLEQHIYGSTDWHLPSPSSTPKSGAFPDTTFKTPKAQLLQQSQFIDTWSTPQVNVNGHQTPAQTPSFAISTPIGRPSSSYSQTLRTPEDPEFHVNHFTTNSLPLPPVDPSRRLSSSPGPSSSQNAEGTLRGNPSVRPRPVTMDMSQMQTPPPTRDATSRRSFQQQSAGQGFATPATVIASTPGQVHGHDALFNQTPLGFPHLQFSPDMLQFSNTDPMSAPALPQSRLFWDQSSDPSTMDVDVAIASDPFGPTPYRVDNPTTWEPFQSPPAQMNPQAFQALHGQPQQSLQFGVNTSQVHTDASSRPGSFVSTTQGVDPTILFGFSSPSPATSFNTQPLQPKPNDDSRQPYELQLRESIREREMAKKAKSQHSRTNTSSSTASFENRPGLQRSNTDSGFRRSRPSSMESKSSGSVGPTHIVRRSSPLKRQSGASLMSIPEIRRPRTRLVIDEDGRARTETVPADNDAAEKARRDSQLDMRRQYPGLFNGDDSDSEPEEPVSLSRNTSFNLPQRRASKHARQDSNELSRSNSFKVPRPSSGIFDKSAFETVRPVRKKAADNPYRRYSMMDFPTSLNNSTEGVDQQMPDSPGNALGALKRVVEGRQKRMERSTQNTLKAHNQRWAADIANQSQSPHGLYDPYSNGFNASPVATTDGGLTTPSTDRSSLSSDVTRCVCNSADDGQPMVQCESCNKWLHMQCVGLHSQNMPPVFVCVFCTGSTPIARGGRVRGPLPQFDSPLTHKSVFRR